MFAGDASHTLEEVREVNEAFVQHYNQERPNQALSCGNRPPRVAFPSLPALPPAPGLVDPDAWLRHVHGRHFVRKVRHNGTVLLDDIPYYVQQALAGHYVDLCVNAVQQEVIVWHEQQPLKRIPIKGLYKTLLPFEECVAVMEQQALTEQRRLQQARRRASIDAA
jgi:hypothetical protein